MDQFDRATELEEKHREIAILAEREKCTRDWEAAVCTGCDYVTKSNYGKRCEAYADCLQDLQKRERAEQQRSV